MKPTAFIASSTEGLGIARGLQTALQESVCCTVWDQGVFEPSHYPLPDLLAGIGRSDFAVFVLTADDILISRGRRQPATRDNVLLELGMSLGKLGVKRSLVVRAWGVEQVRLPSDLEGLTQIRCDPAGAPEAIGKAAREVSSVVANLGPKDVLFLDAFEGDIHGRWQITGNGCTARDGTLEVAGSAGGDECVAITRGGGQWSDYVMQFGARIERKCLGVVIRARDIGNLYMLQIGEQGIRPHSLRTFVAAVSPGDVSASATTKVLTGEHWDPNIEAAPLEVQPGVWFDVEVAVDGRDARMLVNGREVLLRPGLLDILYGAVGFRNWGEERALVRNLVVRRLHRVSED
jgi:hypothetical protein